MATIKLKFRPSSIPSKPGTIYFQITHKGQTKIYTTSVHVYPSEWNNTTSAIVCKADSVRTAYIVLAKNQIEVEYKRICQIVADFERKGTCSVADIIAECRKPQSSSTSLFGYIHLQIDHMSNVGKSSTASNYKAALKSISSFLLNQDLPLACIDSELMERYEYWMRKHDICRNTTSFYMRILRSVYNKAVAEGVIKDVRPFTRVYTGVDKTAKRAITLEEIRRIKKLNLKACPKLELSRDLFLFSFYTRGMSFIDMSRLHTYNLKDDILTYTRSKTRQILSVRWEKPMQEIVDRYHSEGSTYLLPIITDDGAEYRQYKNCILMVNRKLKKVAELAGVKTNLTTYVARHSWASIARDKDIPMSIISEGMGHHSELTTRIYLSTIQTSLVDNANRKIICEL